jgi:N-acetylneuraminate synthase/N,N'-diacetyllegionaminate synthase
MTHMKIPSGELTNRPMLRAYARFRLPVLLSTGMGTLEETGAALAVLEDAGARDVTLLQCTSLYPAPAGSLNLKAIETMRDALGVPTGFSDHSLGDTAAVAAVALGARVIEKHFTLDCALPGPDHKASLEPAAFAAMVRRIRDVEEMLGDGIKRPSRDELDTAALVRRSWHAARDLAAGRVIGDGDAVLLRPASGIAATELITGRRVARDIREGQPILVRDLEAA